MTNDDGPDLIDSAEVDCPRCGARPGKPCGPYRSRQGHVARGGVAQRINSRRIKEWHDARDADYNARVAAGEIPPPVQAPGSARKPS